MHSLDQGDSTVSVTGQLNPFSKVTLFKITGGEGHGGVKEEVVHISNSIEIDVSITPVKSAR